ncbi:MAG: hypothetical protein M3071_03150 [Actinomycetota bacterium]|nr:hypothetical protein [Actinomycetota bacterium]
MDEQVGWSRDWTRRQLLVRSAGAAASLSALQLVRAQVARADTGVLTADELAVIAGLGSSILIAAGQSGDGSTVGLLSPATVAQDFLAIPPGVQSQIAGVLDSINSAPSSGTFVSLSDAQRQAFMRDVLAPLAVNVPPDPAFQNAAEADFAAYEAEEDAGTVPSAADSVSADMIDYEPPDPPPNQPPPPSQQPPTESSAQLLAITVLDGLSLVAIPPVSLPTPPSLPSLGLLPSLLQDLLGLPLLGGLDVDQILSIVGQVTDSIDASGYVEAPIYGAPPILADALATWIPGA